MNPASPAGEARELPMFPLGRTLFPSELLPLHVFEPRYQELTRHCLDTDRLFGVALIMRGAEVGSDADQERSDVATLAEILSAEPLEGGRWALGVMGAQRLQVQRWLPDDPYPRAIVSPWPDPDTTVAEAAGPLGDVMATIERIVAFVRESRGIPPTEEHPRVRKEKMSDDPLVAVYQLCSSAPVGQLDRQRLLEAPDTLARLALLGELMVDLEETLQLMGGTDESPLFD